MAMLTTLQPGDLIPADHPIRRIRSVVDAVFGELDGEFDVMHASKGRPSVPPEQLLKATVLMACTRSGRSARSAKRLNYDLLFKWLLDPPIDAKASPRRSRVATCRAITSPLTGRCSKRGRHTGLSTERRASATTAGGS